MASKSLQINFQKKKKICENCQNIKIRLRNNLRFKNFLNHFNFRQQILFKTKTKIYMKTFLFKILTSFRFISKIVEIYWISLYRRHPLTYCGRLTVAKKKTKLTNKCKLLICVCFVSSFNFVCRWKQSAITIKINSYARRCLLSVDILQTKLTNWRKHSWK